MSTTRAKAPTAGDFSPWGASAPIPLCALAPGRRGIPAGAKKYDVTVDSGAGKSVAPKEMVAGYKIKPSAGSLSGQKFIGPGGEIYPNEGEAELDMVNVKGQACVGDFQVAEGIMKPLAAVSDCCDKGNMVLFDSDDPCMLQRDSPEGRAIREIMRNAKSKMQLERKNGVYVTPVWVMPPGSRRSDQPSDMGFRRQGM